MNLLPLIEAKRDGQAHSPAEIWQLVGALVAGELADHQIAAWLMAVYFRGLDSAELPALTRAMRDSGETLVWPTDPRPVVDKHSTGGVGDKVSLVLAPLLAALDFRVPMIAGRALGIAGGTLDKLESIPGFSTRLSRTELVDQVQRLGVAIVGQSDRMVPAARRLHALRDATGTLNHRALITASLLSRKLAEGLNALVLDVKYGRAAFIPSRSEARQLARELVDLAGECGLNTRALLTDMGTPLGQSAGNWLEVKEAVACLQGVGPPDLRELVLACAVSLQVQTGTQSSPAAARSAAMTALNSGAAHRKWEDLLKAQGADLDRYRELLSRDTLAPATQWVRAPASGTVQRCDAFLIGEALREHGAGRLTAEVEIDPTVGVDRLVRPGDLVDAGDALARVHARDAASAERLAAQMAAAFSIGQKPPLIPPLVAEVIEP